MAKKPKESQRRIVNKKARHNYHILQTLEAGIVLTGSDVDGNALTYAIVTGPAHGTLSAVSGANVTYTPVANYNGADTFTFKANDGTVDSAPATVSISVTPVR